MAKLPDIIKSRLWVLVNENDDEQQIMYETSADIVTVESSKFVAKNVLAALNEIADMAANAGVTGVKGNAESTYRKGDVNITAENVGAEPAFEKNTAFNKNFGTTAGTVMEGDDSRVTTAVSDIEAIKQKNTAQDTEIAKKINSSEKGARNGVATLDAQGMVPSSQLPSYVDDVLEFDSKSAFPTTGEDGKIYIAKDTNLQYRWSGTSYVEISPSLALGETAQTAYPGNKGKQNADDIAAIKNGTTAVGKATNVTTNINGKAITSIFEANGTTVKNATNATNAKNAANAIAAMNVTTNINGHAISDIFESDGTTVKNATNAANATNAGIANRVSQVLFIGAATPDNPTMTKWSSFTGRDGLQVGFEEGEFLGDESVSHGKDYTIYHRNIKLSPTGVTPNTYSAVTVDAKGRVTQGFRSFAIIEAGADIPADVPVGGLIIEKMSV